MGENALVQRRHQTFRRHVFPRIGNCTRPRSQQPRREFVAKQRARKPANCTGGWTWTWAYEFGELDLRPRPSSAFSAHKPEGTREQETCPLILIALPHIKSLTHSVSLADNLVRAKRAEKEKRGAAWVNLQLFRSSAVFKIKVATIHQRLFT